MEARPATQPRSRALPTPALPASTLRPPRWGAQLPLPTMGGCETEAVLLVAECRAGTAGCKNARLPMQSRSRALHHGPADEVRRFVSRDRNVANAIARRAPPGSRKQSPGPRSHTLQITRIHKPTRTRSPVCGRQRIAWRASARRVKPSQRWCLLRRLTVASAGGAGRSRNRRKSGLGRPSLATLRGAQTRAAISELTETCSQSKPGAPRTPQTAGTWSSEPALLSGSTAVPL